MHTTNFETQDGKKGWLIHNGDFSGEVRVGWKPDESNGTSVEVVLPDGFLRAIVLSVLTSAIPGKVESLLNRRAGQAFLFDLLFR